MDAYNVQGDVWHDVGVSGGSLDKGLSLGTMYASSSTGGMPLSFISGGFEAFQDGLVIFNSTSPQNPSWSNVTSDDLPYFRDPNTQYVRYGSAGILVVVGGRVTTGDDAALRQMNSIQVYDIAARKWFTQIATGDAPPSSPGYCSAVSAAPDDSSIHLILYGGWTNDQGDFDDDHANRAGVYMLIMPAFHWIRVNTTYANKLVRTTERRVGHSCATYKDRQLLVFGGAFDRFENDNKTCNSTFSPLRMLDLTTLQWQTQWPLKDTTYLVPQPVIDVVGGGSGGGAKQANTWQQTLGDNVALFSKTVPRYDPERPPQNNFETTDDAGIAVPTSSGNPDSGVSKGAVAGAVVGGVAGLALIVAVISFLILWLRRSQRSYDARGQLWQKSELETETESEKPSLATRLGLNKRHEIGDHDPAKLQLREMDGQSARVEAPDVQSPRSDRRHELGG